MPTGLRGGRLGRARPPSRGAGEILLTSMDRDGTKDGFDIDLLARRRRRGAGAGDRLGRRGQPRALRRAAVSVGRADAVLAASVFHDGVYSIAEVKAAMRAGRASQVRA